MSFNHNFNTGEFRHPITSLECLLSIIMLCFSLYWLLCPPSLGQDDCQELWGTFFKFQVQQNEVRLLSVFPAKPSLHPIGCDWVMLPSLQPSLASGIQWPEWSGSSHVSSPGAGVASPCPEACGLGRGQDVDDSSEKNWSIVTRISIKQCILY